MVIRVYWLLTMYGERRYGYQCVLVTDRVWRERDTASGASRCLPFYRGLNLSLQHHFCILPVNNKTDQTIKSHRKISQKQNLISLLPSQSQWSRTTFFLPPSGWLLCRRFQE